MANGPDLDEITTTTQRNRSAKPKKSEPAMPFARKGKMVQANSYDGEEIQAKKPSKKAAHMKKFEEYEGSPQDEAEDKRGAKRMGMTPEEYEGSPQDEAEDRKGSKRTGGNDGQKRHVGIAIMIAPMSNPPAEHRASVRNSINKAVATIKRRK